LQKLYRRQITTTMAFFNLAQTDNVIIVVALSVLAVGVIGAVAAVLTTLKRYKYTTKTERQKMQGSDEQISADDYLEEIEMRGDSLVLVRNVVYKVGQDGQLEEGTYTLRSAIEGETEFQVRHNDTTNWVQDGTSITLAQGDSIACLTHSMLVIKQ